MYLPACIFDTCVTSTFLLPFFEFPSFQNPIHARRSQSGNLRFCVSTGCLQYRSSRRPIWIKMQSRETCVLTDLPNVLTGRENVLRHSPHDYFVPSKYQKQYILRANSRRNIKWIGLCLNQIPWRWILGPEDEKTL
jgi:hypothetical protein